MATQGLCNRDSRLMTDVLTETGKLRFPGNGLEPQSRETAVLVVAWSFEEPFRAGEVLLVPAGAPGPKRLFGRGAPRSGDRHQRLELVRQRPGASASAGTLQAAGV